MHTEIDIDYTCNYRIDVFERKDAFQNCLALSSRKTVGQSLKEETDHEKICEVMESDVKKEELSSMKNFRRK